MLNQLSIKEFLSKTIGNDPVPGGGSVSALNGALAAALGGMVAGLTIGKKKYADVEPEMISILETIAPVVEELEADIDRDSDAYNEVFSSFKLPKATEEEKRLRQEAIDLATRHAAEVPMSVACKVIKIFPLLEELVNKGNHNAVTDVCVASMCARTAMLGALLNVEINLSSLSDTEYVAEMKEKCEALRSEAIKMEEKILETAKQYIY